jgi:hypothetical protein
MRELSGEDIDQSLLEVRFRSVRQARADRSVVLGTFEQAGEALARYPAGSGSSRPSRNARSMACFAHLSASLFVL